MNLRTTGPHAWRAALISIATLPPQTSQATIVDFQTVMGTFEVNLSDNLTPAAVANFLEYVHNGDYTSSVIHRSVPGFVIQGGGFTYDMALPLGDVPARPAVVNEPDYSNVRGTIAMAKLGGDPNSATSQWFFNLADNAANLNGQNGGFTVFGEVVGDGMDVVDAIAGLPVYNFSGATSELPLRNYTATDFSNGVTVDDNHLVLISAIIVSDSTVDSAAGLNPPANTSNEPDGPTLDGNGGGGGGAFGLLGLLTLALSGGVKLAKRSQR